MSYDMTYHDQVLEIARKMSANNRKLLVKAINNMGMSMYHYNNFDATVETFYAMLKKNKGHIVTTKGVRRGAESDPGNCEFEVQLKTKSKEKSQYVIDLRAVSEDSDEQSISSLMIHVSGSNNILPVDYRRIFISDFTGKQADISEWVASIAHTIFLRYVEADRQIELMKNNVYEIDLK